MVAARYQLVIQVHQIALKVLLKQQRVPCITLCPAAVVIRLKKFRNSQVSLHGLLIPPDGPNVVAIVLIVVVLVAIIEVLFPCVRCGVL